MGIRFRKAYPVKIGSHQATRNMLFKIELNREDVTPRCPNMITLKPIKKCG